MSSRAIVEEALRRKQQRLDWQPDKILFDKQRAVFDDAARYLLLRCGRRSGKSYTWGVMLVDAGLRYPNSTPLYCTMSRQDGRDILWPVIQDLDDRFQVVAEGGFNRANGDITLRNGSRILIRGAGTMREINKLRGRKYPLAVVDEAQNFGPDLMYLLDEAIEPATADYHGTIGLSGTPGPHPSGPFFEMDLGAARAAWSHHHWTFLDNPTMPNPEEFIDKVMERRGWDHQHPGLQREYYGQWVSDDSGRAFKLRQGVSIVEHWPEDQASDWVFYLGIDVGFVDPFGWVVLAASANLGEAYVLMSDQQGELTTGEALARTERICTKWPISRIALDTGGAGKLIEADWTKLTNLPIQAAQKTHKGSQISVINGDFQAGKLRIVRSGNQDLIRDLQTLEWDPDYRARGKFVYRKYSNDHMADALQYAYNLTHHHLWDPQRDNSVEVGSSAWYREKERRMFENACREAGSRGTGTPWDQMMG